MFSSRHRLALTVLAVPFVAGCSDAAMHDGTTLTDISPAPFATGTAVSTRLTLTFSRPMMPGMEQYVDLHEGGVSGPVVPMACGWIAGQTILSCTPTDPLAPGSRYTIHVGGGIRDERGRIMTMEDWTSMGGQWVSGGMMGGAHAGQPVGMMGPGWNHVPGHYGMQFEFTTS
jgi:hypothetical protein